MSICIYHVVNSDKSIDDCPDCLIKKSKDRILNYEFQIAELKYCLKDQDWDTALAVCQNLIDIMERSK